jgi:hypothetical protein
MIKRSFAPFEHCDGDVRRVKKHCMPAGARLKKSQCVGLDRIAEVSHTFRPMSDGYL